jgi:hypothetical protein
MERAVHLTRGTQRDWLRRVVAILAVVYVPLLVFGAISRIVTGEWIPALTQVSTHVRGLVAIPLLLAAEHLVDARARAFGNYMVASGLVSPVEDVYRAAVARVIRLRDSAIAETALLVLAIASLLFKGTYVGTGALAMWGALPEVIVFRFLLLRWVWRWLLWTAFLWRLSRMPLALRATHPDRLAGLGPVLGPAYALTAVVAGCSAAIAGGWAEQMLEAHVPLSTYYKPAGMYAVLSIMLVLAPGCVFAGMLYRARKAGLGVYGAFAQRYVDAFDAKWMAARGQDALGAADISGLADLGGSYVVVGEMRVVPWASRLIKITVVAALVPILSLALIDRDVSDLIAQLGKALL